MAMTLYRGCDGAPVPRLRAGGAGRVRAHVSTVATVVEVRAAARWTTGRRRPFPGRRERGRYRCRAVFTDRNREIVRLHHEGLSLAEVGERFGISAERARQIVRSGESGGPKKRKASGAAARIRGGAVNGERVRLRIGNLGKAVLVSGQAYQDPKDALNEFVSNAADEYIQSEQPGGRIAVLLRRKGKRPVIAVDDVGRGLSPERLREIARNLFESTKAGDERTLGEKAIGLLAFQQLGGRCDIVSRGVGSDETWTLRLERGSPDASLMKERRRARQVSGTTVYLSELDPEALRVLTQRKVVDYLRRRRAAALARGDYSIEVMEGRTIELVTPEEPEGVRLDIPARPTLWGRIEFALYVTADPDRRRRVAVVGKAGTTVIDDVADLDEFDHEPWTSGQVTGQVLFEALQQTAGRRAVLRDRGAFPVFRDALQAVEPAVARAVVRVRREVDVQTADRLSDTVRKVFSRVLKELADLDNPMRTTVGGEPGEGGLLEGGSTGDLFDEPPDPAEVARRPGMSRGSTTCCRRSGRQSTTTGRATAMAPRGAQPNRDGRAISPTWPLIPSLVPSGAGSTQSLRPCSTTTATPTSSSSRTTRWPYSTTWRRW